MNSKNFSWLLITLFFALKLNGAETTSPFEAGLPAICYSQDDLQEYDSSEMDLNQYIDMLKRVVEENNRYVGFLSADRIYQLPIGLHKNIGGVDFTIVLDNLRIDAGGGWISAYMTIELPGANERVGLYADNVRITKNGIQTAQLKMIQDRALDIGGFTLKLKQDETNVQWNCNGYESTTIGGELIFNNELLFPVLPDGTPEPSLPLVGRFLASFEDLNNIMAGIDLPDFQISGLPDMTFSTGETMLDMSDFDNPENQSFPDGFFEGSYNTDMANLWRGVYIHSFSVQLPEQFSNSAEGLTLGAEGLIIDNNGITGNLFASNIIGLEQGDLGGWQFSLDELGFSLMKNNFQSFQFAGQIRLPIAQEDQTFGYEGIVGDSLNMTFAIETLETMQADLWAAQLTLAQNSSVQIEKEGHEYTPSARLHGGMTVALSDEVELAEFTFEDLVISSREPHLSIGHFGMPNGVLAGFPVNISDINFRNEGSKAGIAMQANVNFMKDTASGFSGNGGFTIWAEKQSGQWGFDRLQMQSITINVEQGAYEFHGMVSFYENDPVFGKGFKGMVQVAFPSGILVDASLQLGNVDNYRYWYADALLVTPGGVVMFPGSALYGFGGGISYRMTRSAPDGFSDVSVGFTATDESPQPGASLSGAEYMPSADAGLGLSAKVVLGTHPNPNALNGSIELAFEFNNSGGLNSIRFFGAGVMMADLNSNPGNAKVGAELDIYYNFNNAELYGTTSVFVNVPGIIKGAHANNRAGTVVTYFSQADWFVYAGKPTDRIALKLLGFMETSSYLMVGSDIEPFPDLPDYVASLQGDNKQTLETALTESGSGFAFGSQFEFDTGEMEFMMFFASFELQAGFDFMLKQYSGSTHCEGSSGPIGINNWYAKGQVYAHMGGKVGIKVKIFRKHKRFTIISVDGGAMLKAALPNPLFLRGAAEGHYSILNGLVKGQCTFEFSVGEECVVQGELASLNIISEISPNDGAEEVDVFMVPRVAFNYSVNQTFELLDTDDETKEFRIVLEDFSIDTGDEKYSGANAWNADNNVLSFSTTDLLPSEMEVSVYVKVALQYKVDDEWEPYENDGVPEVEEMEVTFTTGPRPTAVPPHCVEYNYPMDNMHNFYPQEYGQGYLQLTSNLGFLFEDDDDWECKAVFVGSTRHYTDFSYDENALSLTFDIPTDLAAERVYDFRMVRIPKNVEDMDIDEGIEDDITVSDNDTITEQDIVALRGVANEEITYDVRFRVSRYATLSEKISHWDFYTSYSYPITTGVHGLLAKGSIEELFSSREVSNYFGTNLITFTMSLEENSWFMDAIHPYLYQGYPIDEQMQLTNRNTDVFGVPPSLIDVGVESLADVVDNEPGTLLSYGTVDAKVRYLGIPVMHSDNVCLRAAASQLLDQNPNHPQRQRLLQMVDYWVPPTQLGQTFVVTFQYRLPGIDLVTSTETINIDI